jgi:hypothetical protein
MQVPGQSAAAAYCIQHDVCEQPGRLPLISKVHGGRHHAAVPRDGCKLPGRLPLVACGRKAHGDGEREPERVGQVVTPDSGGLTTAS